MSKRVQHNRPTRVAMYSDCELTTEFKSVRLEIAELWLLIYHRERIVRSSFLQLRKFKKETSVSEVSDGVSRLWINSKY